MSRHSASLVSDGYRCTRTGPVCEPQPRRTSSQDTLFLQVKAVRRTRHRDGQSERLSPSNTEAWFRNRH
jgi:hypothetical protein